MPYTLDTPVLSVDQEILHKVDAGNPQNMFSMWTVFSKCADSVQQGRRLEYICWRYWNKHTICNESAVSLTSTTSPKEIRALSTVSDLPQLSASVETVPENDEAVEFTAESSPVDIRPGIVRQDSSSRSRARSPKSESFEKLVTSILKGEAGIPKPTPKAIPVANKPQTLPAGLQRSGSTTTESSSQSSQDVSEMSQASPESSRTHSIVKGFSPSIMPISRTSPKASPESVPEVKPIVAPRLTKKPAVFMVGASGSSSEQPSPKLRKPAKARMFKLGSSNSSEEGNSLKNTLLQARSGASASHKKHGSMRPHVTMKINDEAAIDDSETDADDVDESAIDDDEDDSDWEDSDEASGQPSIEEPIFKRVPSVVQLPSRPSLLTLGFQANERAKRLGNGNVASQSTSALRSRAMQKAPALAGSPNDSDEHPLMMKGGKNAQLRPINEVPRTAAQPINAMAIPINTQAALSPRATRRHMLATELTDSLRRHMVWERQYKHSTANAVLKRRHTSHDLANMKQHPEPAYMNKAEDQNANSFNQFFTKDAYSGYHAKGW